MSGKLEILMVRCPGCGKRSPWKDNRYRPFCSEKCRLIDLGRWADEEYCVPGDPVVVENASCEEL
ncbi:MAG: DNA gyrase inhibitor YacG [Desulfuromonadaceae bacterium]|jgi:uncharacterized protein